MSQLDDGLVRQLHAAIAALFAGGPAAFVDNASAALAAAGGGPVIAAGYAGRAGWRSLVGERPPRDRGAPGLRPLPAGDPWADGVAGRWLGQISHGGGAWSAWLLAPDGVPNPAAWDPARQAVARAGSLWLGPVDEPDSAPTEAVSSGPDLYAGLEATTADCLRLAAQSWSNREIAAWLGISRATVTRRLRQAYDHLGVDGRRALPLQRLLDRPKPARHRPMEGP